MPWILVSSVALRGLACAWSLALAIRLRDRRLVLLTATLALMTARQLLSLQARPLPPAHTELPGLVVSALALGAVYFVGGMLVESGRTQAALRAREAYFRMVVEHGADIVLVLDERGLVRYVSPLIRSLGYEPEALLGRYAPALVVPEDHPLIESEFRAALTHPGAPHRATCRLRGADGGVRWYDARGAMVEMPEGRRVLIALHDVSAQRKAAEERRELEAQLYQAQKMETLGTLAGGIAHDFNNILTPIVGSAELARNALPPESPAQAHLVQIVDAAAQARELIQRMLLIARRSAGGREPVDLREVVEDTLPLVRTSLPPSISVVSVLADRPLGVMADAVQLHQVVMNLCTNAAHAMRDGGGELRVELSAVSGSGELASRAPELAQGEWVRLSVSDSGCGMDAATLKRVFEPFFSTKEVGSGSGLGLSVVHGIVTGHGGVVDVHSEPNKGARFDIFLRACELPARRPSHCRTVPSKPRPGRLLVVDDQPAVLRVTQELLSLSGFEVETCDGPERALQVFREDPDAFQAVVTDQSMPGMTGVALAAELARLRPDVAVILTTGFAETEVLERGSDSPIVEVLSKPFGMDELVQAVQRARRTRVHQGDEASDCSSEAQA